MSYNSQLETKLKNFLPELQSFFKQLDASKLSRLQLKDRDDLLKKIGDLLTDLFPNQSKSNSSNNNNNDAASVHSEKRGSDDEAEETYEVFDEPNSKPAPPSQRRISEAPSNFIVSAADVLDGCRISGNLTRKNVTKGKFDLQNIVIKLFGKKFCAVKQGVLYVFEKNTSKKQDLLIVLKDYEIRNVYDKKEWIFELVSPGKPSFMFATMSESDRTRWTDILEREVLVAADTKLSIISSDDEMYEYADNGSPVRNGFVDEIYDDITMEPEPTRFNNNNNINKFNNNNNPIEEIYEMDEPAISAATTAKKTPVQQETTRPTIVEGDVNPQGMRYDGLYYGLWDCRADAKDELFFKQGEMVEIVGKDYEKFGWWVGRVNGKVGIVPKEYLTPAYRAITA